MPGESLVLVGGFLRDKGARSGIPHLCDLHRRNSRRHIASDWGGIWDENGLKHGRRFGLRQEHLDRVDGLFAKLGGKAVLVVISAPVAAIDALRRG
jgi:hypothetical protein